MQESSILEVGFEFHQLNQPGMYCEMIKAPIEADKGMVGLMWQMRDFPGA